MHTKFCEHGDGQDDIDDRREAWREWWPQGSPAEVDVSTLSATPNDLSNATRLPPIDGDARWLGIWGNYAGLRIGFSPSESFQALSPCVVAYPDGVDLYLSKDTGGAGIASLGRFKSRAAAIAFCGSRPSATSKIPPSATGFTPADATANPAGTLGGSEVFNMGFNGTTWDRLRSAALNADALTPPTLGAMLAAAQGMVFSDRSLGLDRLRQPDSRQAAGAVASAVSLNTTGVKLSVTVPANKNVMIKGCGVYNLAAVAATIRMELVRSAVTYFIGTLVLPAAVGQSSFMPTGSGAEMPLVAGDVLQLNVTTAGATTADIFIAYVQDRFTF